MSDIVYRTDMLAIQEQQDERAALALNVIEEKSNASPLAFLKDNLDNKKIRERSTEPEIKILIGAMLTKICALAGIKNEVDQVTGQDIQRMIFGRYSDLTVEELYKAFELERYGAYESKTEHFQLFNADYISSVLGKYKTWKHSIKQHHDISKTLAGGLPEMSESAKKELMDNAIIRVFTEFKETGEVPIPNGHIFDEIWQRKLFPEDTKYELYLKIAKRELEAELRSTKSVSKAERNAVTEALNKISVDGNEKVLAKAKKLVLHDYFDKIVSIEEIINVK